MAPLCSDPRQIVINFNPARRRALLQLVDEITNHMLDELQASPDELGPVTTANSGPGTPSSSGTSTPAPSQSQQQQQQQQQQQAAPSSPVVQEDGTNSSSNVNTGGKKFDLGAKFKNLMPKPAQEALRIQSAAVRHLEDWKADFMPKLTEIVTVDDDDKIRTERRKRVEAMEKGAPELQPYAPPSQGGSSAGADRSEDFFALQLLYAPVPTRLTTVPLRDRQEAVSCILLLLLSTGKYSAHSRALALYLSAALELSQSFLIREELEIAQTLIESSSSTGEDQRQASMSAEAEAAKRRDDNRVGRFLKVGLASVVGATVIGVTGGLAAPLVAGALGGVLGGIGLGGVASFLGIFWMNGALVGTLFGAFGAKMTGEMMDSYAKEVEDFKFIPLQANLTGRDVGRARDPGKDGAAVFASGDQLNRRLRITIGVNGWLSTEEDITRPWHVFSNETEVFALRYEMRTLLGVGTAFTDLVKSAAWNTLRYQVIRHTVFATLMAALWPISVLGAASRADNPFSRGLNRSRKAGRLLADALVNRVQGERPVTLVGYSLGAAAIHACLQSLAQRRAFGLIDTVVLVGAPAPSSPEHWRTLRSVVSGKIFNVYSQNDMILGLVYRAYSMSTGAAGLQPIPRVDGLENLDLSPCVSGHLRYPDLLGEILRKCAFPGVDATDDIPMDDVMILKDEYKHGKIDDAEIDGQIRESDRLQQQQDQKEQQARELPIRPAAAGAGAAGAAGVAAGAGAVAASSDKGQDDVLPPLPRRPTEDVDVPDRPPPPYESVSTPAGIPTRKPVPPPRTGTSRTLSEPARPHTPDAPIMMIDNDYTP